MGGILKTSFKMVDADAVKKICDIYDWDGKGELDLFFLGDVMYALGMNTTKKVCVGLDRLMKKERSLPSLMTSLRRSMLPRPLLTPLEPTTTTLSFSSCMTKTAMEQWCLLSLKTFLPILVMKSQRKMSRNYSLSSVTLKMRTDSSLTCHLWTGSVARHKQQTLSTIPNYSFHLRISNKKIIIMIIIQNIENKTMTSNFATYACTFPIVK